MAWNQKVKCDIDKFRTTTGIDSSSGATVTNRQDYLIAQVAGFSQTRLKSVLMSCPPLYSIASIFFKVLTFPMRLPVEMRHYKLCGAGSVKITGLSYKNISCMSVYC